MKYKPDFPARFGYIEDTRAYCQTFFAWYNTTHRHSGIGYMTPHSVHYGQAHELRDIRQAALDCAFLASPMRFKGVVLDPQRCPPLPASTRHHRRPPPKRNQPPAQ
jgi:putative transposase